MGSSRVLYVFALLVSISLAQNSLLGSLPSCAVECFNEALPISSCSPSDLACLCRDAAFMGSIQGCEFASCTIKEVLTSTNSTLSACGVPKGDVSATVLAIPASFGSLALLMFLLRIFDRAYLRKLDPGWDDYLLAAGVSLGAVLNFVCIPMVQHGIGRDFWSLSFSEIDTTLQLLYVAEIFYFPSEMFTQLSILAFYRRIFASASVPLQRGSIILMVFVVLFGVANTLVIIFQCTPVDYFWRGWAGETSGHCININLFSWARAAIEIAVDIAILSLPLRDVARLQLSWKMKVQVLFMFSLGFIITIVSILRLQSLIQFAQTTNPTYDNAPAIYWSVLECDIFIISACLPSIRSLCMMVFPRAFRTRKTDSDVLGSRGYQRHSDLGPDQNWSSYHLESLPGSGQIMKSVDLHISHEYRKTGDDRELLVSQAGHVYGS